MAMPLLLRFFFAPIGSTARTCISLFSLPHRLHLPFLLGDESRPHPCTEEKGEQGCGRLSSPSFILQAAVTLDEQEGSFFLPQHAPDIFSHINQPFQIAENIQDAPFLVCLYSRQKVSNELERELVGVEEQNWSKMKSSLKEKVPDGMILVEELKEIKKEAEASSYGAC
ncbi:uncharacterized protein LOC116253408 [Nymphaea colorata]|nr:uncharacterized protein LOC116253408 [Nymphaea colorata]